MPTGYTAKIKDGQTFEEYALECARAFGALIHMRDEPSNAEITFPSVGEYYPKRIVECKQKVKEILDWSEEDIKLEYEEYVRNHYDYGEKVNRERKELKVKYQKVLAEARAYQPPSQDHQEYRNFMISQLEKSIDHDCSPYEVRPITMSSSEWYDAQVKMATDSLSRAIESLEKEQENVNKKKEWLIDLYISLGIPIETTQ